MKHVLQNKKYKNRELEILQQIAHENIVRLHGSFFMEEKEGTFLNLVMEYIPETLSKAVKINYASKTFLPTNMVKTYAKSLLQALQYLHIKPSNILINNVAAKLCDFGSAKILAAGQKNIAYICSRYYRAPELLFGAIFYTQQVDIWSLGCVIA
jgi:glycogen synthase kinase 3 beta